MLSTYEFHNRKPSITQINACIKNALMDNARTIEISWGENCLTIQRTGSNPNWYGSGWIKGISGDDLAQELNKAQAQQFVDNHFQFISIR